MQEQRQLTHENVQRKQARTGEEREEEDEEQLSESESEDEDNEIIYNPKNLPLGWDGKVRPHMSDLDQREQRGRAFAQWGGRLKYDGGQRTSDC